MEGHLLKIYPVPIHVHRSNAVYNPSVNIKFYPRNTKICIFFDFTSHNWQIILKNLSATENAGYTFVDVRQSPHLIQSILICFQTLC